MAIKHSTTVTDGVDVYNKSKWEANHVIDDETITEALLDVLNSPTNNYVLAYDSAAGRFKWVTQSGGGGGGGDVTGPSSSVADDLAAFLDATGKVLKDSGKKLSDLVLTGDSRLSDARTPTAHQLDGALHTVSGLTAGQFLKALTTTTFGFAAHGLGYGDVGAEASGAVSTHAALTTTVHGVGAGTIAKVGDIATDGNLSANAQDAVSKRHSRSHLITGTSDHDPTGLTASQLLRLNAGATAIESSGKAVTDFEASGAVSTHAALTTGVHGVAGGTVAKVADIATDANLSTAAQAAITASHARSHSLVSASDHSSAVAVGKHFKADANGLPVEATNTDAEIAAAITASHAAASVAGAPLTLAGQAITFNKSASHFDLSGNNLILKAAGHGSAQHDSTTYLGGRYIVDNLQRIQPTRQGTQVGAVGRVHFTFIDIPRPCTLDAIGFKMVTKGGAGTNYRLGIYPTVADIPDGQAVLFDSGDITAVPANIGLTEIAVNQVIATAGLYALCLETADATISFFRYSPMADPDNVLVAKAWGCRYDRGGGYGALTTPCPVTTADLYVAPQMFVRVGSWQG